jgi:hypothetical protein
MICINAAGLGGLGEVTVLMYFSYSIAAEYEVSALVNQKSVVKFSKKIITFVVLQILWGLLHEATLNNNVKHLLCAN